MALFEIGDFISHAGLPLAWKIECDALSRQDWRALAKMIHEYEPRPWRKAVGIPRGGVLLGEYCDEYSTGNKQDPILIVDDVYTTGTSFKEFKKNGYAFDPVIQWCVFARKPIGNGWGKEVIATKALFTMPPEAGVFQQAETKQ